MKEKYAYLYNSLLFFSLLILISCNDQDKSKFPENTAVESNTNKTVTLVSKPSSSIANKSPLFTQIHSNLGGRVSEFIRKMYQDTSGNFWFGSNGDGVIRYDGTKLAKFTINEGFGGSAVRAIKEDKFGNVWFGTSGGLTKYDGLTFTTFAKESEFFDNEIWSLEIDRNGKIWVGDLDGASVFDGENFINFPIPLADVENPQPMLSPMRIADILQDKNGNMWFVTDGSGISIYDGNKFTHLTKRNGLPDNNVADVLEDKQGNIWIGTYYGGVSRYDGTTFFNYTQEGIIKGVETYNFYEDIESNIWFSAENEGVYRYDGKSFTQYTSQDGLASNGIQSIYQDAKGHIWFGTWSGLSIYDGNLFSDAKLWEPWVQ